MRETEHEQRCKSEVQVEHIPHLVSTAETDDRTCKASACLVSSCTLARNLSFSSLVLVLRPRVAS